MAMRAHNGAGTLQWQRLARQLFSLGVQSVHAAPFFPHSVSLVPATHAPAAQHPAHVPGPQMQEPPLHASPAAHAGPEPHWHRPLAAQLSARRVSHTAQAPPPVPHSSIEGAAHVLPAQQPPGQ